MKQRSAAFALIIFCICIMAGISGADEILSKKAFSEVTGFVWRGKTLKCSAVREPDATTRFVNGVNCDFDLQKYHDKMVRLSAEVRWLDSKVAGRQQGVIHLVTTDKTGKESVAGLAVGPDQKDWQAVSKVMKLAADATAFKLFIGFEKSCGAFEIRNLKIEILGQPVPLAICANRTLRDAVANDGAGGWLDGGPLKDGRAFEPFLQENLIGGVPFSIPVNSNDNQILVMKSKRHKEGAEQGNVAVSPYAAKYLYVLQTLAYPGKTGSMAGRILVEGSKNSQEIPVVVGRDLGDWYKGKPVSAASDFVRAKGYRADLVLYTTKYKLDSDIGDVTNITFLPTDDWKIWVICGATLTQKEYAFQAPRKKQPLTIEENDEWQPAIRHKDYHFRFPNSALDVTRFSGRKPIGPEDRIIINDEGHFAYEKDPARTVRFLCSSNDMRFSWPRWLYNRGHIGWFVDDLKTHGYNLIRLWMNRALMYGAGKEAEFNYVAVDNLDWLIHLCRKEGIYLMTNIMESKSGFFPIRFDQWGNTTSTAFRNAEDEMDVLFALYFSEKARRDWELGATNLLNHVNPYTKTALKNEPVLMMLEGYNEHEFAFYYRPLTKANREMAVGPYRKFLQKRYGTIDAYNAKNSTKFASFDEIPCFSVKRKTADANDFLYEVSRDWVVWCKSVLKKIGYRGHFTDYDFVKSLKYHFVRKECDFVGMHIYHDHPQPGPKGLTKAGAHLRQFSAIERGNFLARSLFGARLFQKPLTCTEYGIPFWNKYRYELPFTVGAYSAFQGIDALTVFGNNPTRRQEFTDNNEWKGGKMIPFKGSCDPLNDASELLTFFMYIRGDVSPATHFVRIVADKETVYKNRLTPNAAPALEQTALSLLTGYYQESLLPGQEITPLTDNEIMLPSIGGGGMRVKDKCTETVGETRNISDYVRLLKDKGQLTEDNRTDGTGIYESSTKELYLDMNRKFMTVNTPRLQGMCGLAGATCELDDFKVVSHDRNGNLTVVSIDGEKPIAEAGRLLLVRMTNALNSNMKFEDKDMRTLEYIGDVPGLLQTSKFTVVVRNTRANKLKLYPLSLEGARTGKKIVPVKVEGDFATFTVDTSSDGNTLYFELSVK